MEVFVFGSNEAGRHGKGAALHALKHHGAIYGLGAGMQGKSFGICTKDAKLKPLPLERIQKNVNTFIAFATKHPFFTFNVTRIGCGLAGYQDHQIAPMFKHAPINCNLPQGWREYG